jgi:hypothetical protein
MPPQSADPQGFGRNAAVEEECRQRHRPREVVPAQWMKSRHPTLRPAPLQRQRTGAASTCPPAEG